MYLSHVGTALMTWWKSCNLCVGYLELEPRFTPGNINQLKNLLELLKFITCDAFSKRHTHNICVIKF